MAGEEAGQPMVEEADQLMVEEADQLMIELAAILRSHPAELQRQWAGKFLRIMHIVGPIAIPPDGPASGGRHAAVPGVGTVVTTTLATCPYCLQQLTIEMK